MIVKILREMFALRGELEALQRPGGPANPPTSPRCAIARLGPAGNP